MAAGIIPIESFHSPIPDGFAGACEQSLVSAGFGPLFSIAPDGVHVSDVATVTNIIRTYVGSPAHMAVLRSAASYALSSLFATKIAAGRVYTDGKSYQIDPASQANINAMASLAIAIMNNTPNAQPWPAGFYWIAADNTHTPLTAQQMYDFAQDVAGYVSKLVLTNRAIKDQINAAADPSTLDAININSGWPSNP